MRIVYLFCRLQLLTLRLHRNVSQEIMLSYYLPYACQLLLFSKGICLPSCLFLPCSRICHRQEAHVLYKYSFLLFFPMMLLRDAAVSFYKVWLPHINIRVSFSLSNLLFRAVKSFVISTLSNVSISWRIVFYVLSRLCLAEAGVQHGYSELS